MTSLTAALLLSCDDPGDVSREHPGDVSREGAERAEDEGLELAEPDEVEDEPDDPLYWSSTPRDPLYAIDCAEHQDTGYVKGDSFKITVVTVDGKPVEVQTANAFYQMAQAAAKAGVNIKVVSGFRTNAEQQYLYNCYVNCNCNNCNLAAKPGFSNHQSGHALDLNTGGAGVYSWLAKNGGAYGFTETVPSEDWHWEWWGGGPATSGPCGLPDFRAEYVAQSFPPAAQPPLLLNVGEGIDAWIDLKNTGKLAWTANTRLAPTPRDQPSPLADVGWMSPTRITGPKADTAPGAVGRFEFHLAGTTPGDYTQTFGLVEEGVTWFSDAPKGGGPPDTQLAVHVVVIEPPPPYVPPPPPPPPPPSPSPDPTPMPPEDPTGGEGFTGTSGQGAGDMSEGTATSDPVASEGDEGAMGFDDEAGCGCRGSSQPAGLGLAVGLLAWARRRRRT
ncbi:MAG: D-alanyl-D-alanine carboxypeptidase family protein [Nannocystis sp.]|nr:M15 family metallopeptidase [Nannocystis sp.]MBA3547642.1 D-alanyl-D-alanine carboxypeptidase family protein [Nannocystis sp.]